MPSTVKTGVRVLWVAGVLFVWANAAHAQAPGLPSAEVPAIAGPAQRGGVPVENLTPAPAPETLAGPQPIKLRFEAKPAPPPAPAERSGLSPTVFWIAASATIITASLGGFEALHVRALYDQAKGIPAVSPQQEPLHDQMRGAEIRADALLLGSLALAVGSTILAFHIEWSGSDPAHEQLAERKLPPPIAAAHVPTSAVRRRWW